MIYLDYSANTPADPAVLERFVNTEQTFHGNPNSNHPAGLAAREGLSIVNAPGTVDAGYRGEIKISLINLDPREPIVIAKGDRIAQRKDDLAGNFYPRPPRGGRRDGKESIRNIVSFLSTPSARRATVHHVNHVKDAPISIHALREEGD